MHVKKSRNDQSNLRFGWIIFSASKIFNVLLKKNKTESIFSNKTCLNDYGAVLIIRHPSFPAVPERSVS